MIFTNITCAFNELNKINNNIFIESHNKKKKFFYASKARLNCISSLKINLDKYLKIDQQSFKKKFFCRHSKLVAPDLIGCYLIRNRIDKGLIKGMIVETEAYSQEEEACHGYNKKTPSNKVLFGEPGRFYIYRSYGIHHCLNIVTDKDNFASGVLIRAVFISNKNERSASGPGLVTKTFEVDNKFNSLEILNNKCLWISKGKLSLEKKDLIQTTRIGISKAKNIKWRWYLKRSRSISKREKGDRNPNLKNSTNNLSGVT